MNTRVRFLALIVSIALLVSLSLSCHPEETAERRAIKLVMETVQPDIPESNYTATKNPEGPGWIVTNKGGAKYLVRADKVYAINGWAMTWSPGIPNVRDERITDCPEGYTPLKTPTEQERKVLSEIPLEKRKKIYYELIKYQDEHPGAENARKSYGIIADRYGITKEMLNLIMSEGFEERWPEPGYPR
jgi:hypothetical protein